jgi:hypothetical protein
VRVPQPGDDAGDGQVEVAVGQVAGAFPQQRQLLHRVDRVGGPLGRQVGIRAAENRDQRVEDPLTLPAIEGAGGGWRARFPGCLLRGGWW